MTKKNVQSNVTNLFRTIERLKWKRQFNQFLGFKSTDKQAPE